MLILPVLIVMIRVLDPSVPQVLEQFDHGKELVLRPSAVNKRGNIASMINKRSQKISSK